MRPEEIKENKVYTDEHARVFVIKIVDKFVFFQRARDKSELERMSITSFAGLMRRQVPDFDTSGITGSVALKEKEDLLCSHDCPEKLG